MGTCIATPVPELYPVGRLAPGEPYVVDGLDWSWAFVAFAEIPGWPGYRAASDGRIWSQKAVGRNGRWAEPVQFYRGRERYRHVNLYDRGRKRCASVHRLIAESFLGRRPSSVLACHNDGDCEHNDLYNIRYDTPEANTADREKHGTMNRGENHGRARVNESQVREIRRRYADGGVTYAALASEHGVKPGAIQAMVSGRTWSHIK